MWRLISVSPVDTISFLSLAKTIELSSYLFMDILREALWDCVVLDAAVVFLVFQWTNTNRAAGFRPSASRHLHVTVAATQLKSSISNSIKVQGPLC